MHASNVTRPVPPHLRNSPTAARPSQVGGTLPFTICPARDAHGLNANHSRNQQLVFESGQILE
jgi:hypothetical protein